MTRHMSRTWNRSVKVPLTLLAATLITLTMASGTMAKYVHAIKGQDVARVAQFEVGVKSSDERNGTDDQTAWTIGAAAVNLFSTTLDDTGVYNSSAEAFDSNSGVKLIAPGTSGGFQIDVGNRSEVAVQTSFTLVETFVADKKIPIVYTYKGMNYSSYGETNFVVGGKLINGGLAELAMAIADGIGKLAPSNGTTPVNAAPQTISWSWAFEGGDLQTNTKDTLLATDGNAGGLDQPTITLTITCTAEQLDTYSAS